MKHYVPWLEQQGKYICLKIKKSGGYYRILPKRHFFLYLSPQIAWHWKIVESCSMANFKGNYWG
jgi:hypothetical protein